MGTVRTGFHIGEAKGCLKTDSMEQMRYSNIVLIDVVMLVDPTHSQTGCGWVLKLAIAVASKRNS